MSDLRTRIAAALAAEFDGQARKFDDAGWEGVADAVIHELGLRQEIGYQNNGNIITTLGGETLSHLRQIHRYVTDWTADE